MIAKSPKPNTAGQVKAVAEPGNTTLNDNTQLTMTKSMHQGVEVWCDCCSCEAEPYWLEAMQAAEKP